MARAEHLHPDCNDIFNRSAFRRAIMLLVRACYGYI